MRKKDESMRAGEVSVEPTDSPTASTNEVTPGPWRAMQEYPEDSPCEDGTFWRIDPVTRDDGMAYGYRWLGEADARLAAAAPDLLAACNSALDYWETTGFAECEPGCDCVVDVMRAAIAKAEGRG